MADAWQRPRRIQMIRHRVAFRGVWSSWAAATEGGGNSGGGNSNNRGGKSRAERQDGNSTMMGSAMQEGGYSTIMGSAR